jgi:hypothetical protein
MNITVKIYDVRRQFGGITEPGAKSMLLSHAHKCNTSLDTMLVSTVTCSFSAQCCFIQQSTLLRQLVQKNALSTAAIQPTDSWCDLTKTVAGIRGRFLKSFLDLLASCQANYNNCSEVDLESIEASEETTEVTISADLAASHMLSREDSSAAAAAAAVSAVDCDSNAVSRSGNIVHDGPDATSLIEALQLAPQSITAVVERFATVADQQALAAERIAAAQAVPQYLLQQQLQHVQHWVNWRRQQQHCSLWYHQQQQQQQLQVHWQQQQQQLQQCMVWQQQQQQLQQRQNFLVWQQQQQRQLDQQQHGVHS